MKIHRTNAYEYVLELGLDRYVLDGEWEIKDVVEFIKAVEEA